MKEHYYIYAKPLESGARFKPLDLSTGSFVSKLIYATILDSKEKADKVLKDLKQNNAGFEFKAKRVN